MGLCFVGFKGAGSAYLGTTLQQFQREDQQNLTEKINRERLI